MLLNFQILRNKPSFNNFLNERNNRKHKIEDKLYKNKYEMPSGPRSLTLILTLTKSERHCLISPTLKKQLEEDHIKALV